MPTLRNPRMRFPSVGECIYCGSTENLETEHIIPYGIGGRLELPQASCRECANATSKWETTFQNEMIPDFRVRTRFPNRKGKMKRGRTTLLVRQPDGSHRPIRIDAKDAPAMLTLPAFPEPPKILLGHEWRKRPLLWTSYDPATYSTLAKKHGAPIGTELKFSYLVFTMVLAKIAHAFAFSQLPKSDRQTLTLLLPDLIRKGTPSPPYDLVGGVTPGKMPASDLLHNLRLWTFLADSHEYLVASVRLFSAWGTPPYCVVVGKRPFGVAPSLPTPYVFLR